MKKTGPGARFLYVTAWGQLRSARAMRLVRLAVRPMGAIDVSADELLEPIDVPELLVEPMFVLLFVEPILVEPMLVLVDPVAAEPPVGVPVSPIGVPCELRWPAPTGALLTAGLGGLPWAIAVPMRATAAKPTSRPLSCVDEVINEFLG